MQMKLVLRCKAQKNLKFKYCMGLNTINCMQIGRLQNMGTHISRQQSSIESVPVKCAIQCVISWGF